MTHDGKNERVVITGMGAVSPNGVGNQNFAEAVLAGKSGVRRITHFDPSEISVQIAGEVRNFDELAWVDKHERRHVSRVLPLALAAAQEALTNAGINPKTLPIEERRRFGVILGSGGGSQEFTEEQYRLFFHEHYRRMSLFCVPTGVMGTFSSDVSIRFGLRGPSHMVTTGCTSSTDAIAYSVRQIQSGRADCVLSGGADAPIALGIVKGFILMKIMTDSWNEQPEKASRPFTVNRDGFVLAATHMPGAYDEVVRLLVPELQRRGLFHRDYEGPTLRDNLGLPIPRAADWQAARRRAAE